MALAERVRPLWIGVTESALFRNSVTLISGTVISQAILFVCSPLLSRVFKPADFGNLANYNAWVAVLALLSCLRYEQAIIIARDREESNRVIMLTWALCFVSVVLYAIGAVAIYTLMSNVGYVRTIHDVVLLIPVGVAVLCVASPLQQLNITLGRFKVLAVVATAQVVCTLVPQLVLGLLHVSNGLIFGVMIGTLAAAIMLCVKTLDAVRLAEFRRELDWGRLKLTAREHKKFPRFMLGADIIALISQQFVPVFVQALFNPVVAGLYVFSLRVVRLPLLVIGAAAQNALRKTAMDHIDAPGGLRAVFRTTAIALAAIGAVPFAILALFGRPLFAFVFGATWADAGTIVRIMSPGVILEFIALPLTVFFVVTNHQQYSFLVQTIGFAALSAGFAFGRFVLHDFNSTCVVISAVMFCVNVAATFFAWRAAIAMDAQTNRQNPAAHQNHPPPIEAV